ncbi:MAG TPA: baseplate J/gp47 family protein [Patescibacteria group bacterium]|nr:baseplate J/gp47 family protein [Patescibacteria group bacterium]
MLDFLTKPKEQKENFWALLIEPEWVTSAIWQIESGKVEIISSSPATRWETESNLIEAIDASLSSCTQSLPDEVPDPTKTVFGVPNSWIDGGNIKEEYLEKLKKVCQDLSLVPSGFVVLSEAISHFIREVDEIPLSGIVVGISDENLDISIFNLGKLIGTTSVLRSVSVEEDVTEGLSRLSSSVENLPSRVILFNQKEQELESIKESLNNSDWNKIGNSKFMHTPKVEILDPNKKIMAVALAGGSEMGEVHGVVTQIQEPETETQTENLPEEEVKNVEEPNGITAEDLGFVVEEPKLISSKLPSLTKFNFSMPSLPKIPSNLKIPHINFSLGGKPLIMGGSLILAILAIGFVLWWFLPKATVSLYVTPKKLEENTTLIIGSDIKGEEISVNVSGEKTSSTTGTKTVGEKAKGSVKVQNGTAFPISLPPGTILLSSSELKFQTAKSASVSGALSPSSPGTTTIEVEAVGIGSEYNLAKDEVLKVGNYPKADVDATITDNFSGGSSRQISAVSEEDRKKIAKGLKDELLDEAKEKLSEKITSDQVLVEASLTDEVEEENYSNKVGDEATNLKLSLSLVVKGTVVSRGELLEISKKSLESKVPSGFVLRNDQITYDFKTSDEDNSFDVRISANLLPNIDPVEISKKIVGKYPNLAESFLESVPGFVRAEFRIKPLLPGKLGTLPHLSKNISVEISSSQ